jgi:hypothetical protein
MYSTLALLAFSLPMATQPGKVAWQNNYREARANGIAKHKPLAMFIAPGKDGWKKILAEGAFNANIQRILADNYVPVFIDRDSTEGKKTVAAFGLGDQPALIISSRSGDIQAFRHEGTLTETDLTVCLNRYSSAGLVVTTTESLINATNRVSAAYASPAPAYQNYYAPAFGGCST